MAITAGTWVPINGRTGLNLTIDDHSTVAHHKVGDTVRCRDVGTTDYGEAEFIFLKGVASTVAGDYVAYEGNGVTKRAVARDTGPGAVAMAATVAGEYGWYQRTGRAKVTAGTVADNAQLYLTATPGSLDDAVVAGDLIYGARSDGATDTGFILATLSYPYTGDTDNA